MVDRRCRSVLAVGSLGLLALGAAACATAAEMEGGAAPVAAQVDRASAQRAMAGWHRASQEAATAMMARYGPPNELTPTMAVWHNNGPWKRTIIYREAVPHSFPMPHPDVMEQFVDYRVPVDRYDDLAAYDGSVIAERTRGEMSGRCDKEGANFLAVNLAHEIATGRRTAEDARRVYGEQIRMMMNNQMTPYTSGLMFRPAADAGDPDRPIM